MPLEQRITLRQLSPNPLFDKWLSEWLSYAESKNSLKEHALAKALDSLRRYPLVMHSGRDCCILEGFGQTICRMIDKQLEVYRNDAGSGGNALMRKRPTMSEAECDRSVQEVIGKVQAEMAKKQKQRRMKKKDEAAKDNPIKELFDKYNDEIHHEVEEDDLVEVPEESATKAVAESVQIVIPANTFEIVLLVDTQETAGLVLLFFFFFK